MKYHMRRKDRQINDWAAIEELLARGKYATLALCCNNEPYIVTMNYGYDAADRCLYFHCAADGAKTDFVKANPAACATIIEDKGYVQGKCKHYYRSAVMRGRVEILFDEDKKMRAFETMIRHLEEKPELVMETLPGRMDRFGGMHVWRFVIEEASGKEGS
jgi:uncharacterized protein